MSSVRGKWFITSSFNSYSTRLSRMKTERAIWFLLTAQTCQMEIQRDQRLTGPSKHLHASLCLIWVVQNNPSQQGWPRCFTDDSIKGFTFYLPSLQFHVTAHDGSSGWAAPHCDHQTPPKKQGRGIKTLRSVPPRCRHTCLSEKQTKKNHRQQGFLAPKPENEIWRIEMQKRFYCNSRKTETSFRPGSTARIQF